MDDKQRAEAILRACRNAWADLRGSGPAKKRVRAARLHFSAFTRDGGLAPHVRDVYGSETLGQIEPALHTLQSLARAFAEPEDENKLRPDMNEMAFRVMQEATGQAPKTVPPSERDDDVKNPEAVRRGKKGGEKGGDARASSLTDEEREEIAQTAALARWKKKSN